MQGYTLEDVKNWGKLVAAVLTSLPPQKTDAICIFDRNDLQLELLSCAADIYRSAFPFQPRILINGRARYEATETSWGCAEWRRILEGDVCGVPKGHVLTIPPAEHSGEEAESFVGLCHERGWKSVTVAAPPYYLPRCFLNMLGVMRARGVELQLHCLTVPQIKWEEYATKHAVKGGVVVKGMRFEHLDDELERILTYRAAYLKHDPGISPIASIEEGVEYLKVRR